MWQSFLAPVDLYCERTGPELWAEPANALTNLAFIAAGLWGVREVRRCRTGIFAEVLAWWVVAIGVGSTIFHIFATKGTVWADVVPIAGFTLAYTLFNLRRFLRLEWGKAIAVFVSFYVVAGLITFAVPDWLRQASNGTTGYLPPFLALAFFGLWVAASGNRAGWYNLAGSAIFVLSVICRMVDPLVCTSFPLGTHFLWHLLNGLMLGVLLAAAARYGTPQRGSRQ
ncbi:ceramidase [Mesorhizobium sp. BR1-1-9]|uniref:ceramidase domain-containing protein n=1 Tax=unclassified Mesorhizobium TaxID=325217 RepID=UPI001CD08935|nr:MULTISPECIES: ceramidase domain-containing protein [unclassified Mesorhizobium]MBZ9874844.1 ceramidase [Mesorhizobium sp. BR1-1-9]MBZ9939914.1 ceramidase [Mesorhizobium sp. BR1-1-13]